SCQQSGADGADGGDRAGRWRAWRGDGGRTDPRGGGREPRGSVRAEAARARPAEGCGEDRTDAGACRRAALMMWTRAALMMWTRAAPNSRIVGFAKFRCEGPDGSPDLTCHPGPCAQDPSIRLLRSLWDAGSSGQARG